MKALYDFISNRTESFIFQKHETGWMGPELLEQPNLSQQEQISILKRKPHWIDTCLFLTLKILREGSLLICAVHFSLLTDFPQKNSHPTRGMEYRLPYMVHLLRQRYMKDSCKFYPTVFLPFPTYQPRGLFICPHFLWLMLLSEKDYMSVIFTLQ